MSFPKTILRVVYLSHDVDSTLSQESYRTRVSKSDLIARYLEEGMTVLNARAAAAPTKRTAKRAAPSRTGYVD